MAKEQAGMLESNLQLESFPAVWGSESCLNAVKRNQVFMFIWPFVSLMYKYLLSPLWIDSYNTTVDTLHGDILPPMDIIYTSQQCFRSLKYILDPRGYQRSQLIVLKEHFWYNIAFGVILMRQVNQGFEMATLNYWVSYQWATFYLVR